MEKGGEYLGTRRGTVTNPWVREKIKSGKKKESSKISSKGRGGRRRFCRG